jgi:hypothetical protein
MLVKILLLILVVVVLWYGVRWMSRVQRVLERQERQNERRMEELRDRPPAARPAEPVTADMQRCPVCATFVTGASSCGKEACPYGR